MKLLARVPWKKLDRRYLITFADKAGPLCKRLLLATDSMIHDTCFVAPSPLSESIKVGSVIAHSLLGTHQLLEKGAAEVDGKLLAQVNSGWDRLRGDAGCPELMAALQPVVGAGRGWWH